MVACGGKDEKKSNPPTQGQIELFAVVTDPDSTKSLQIVMRIVNKKVVYDSAAKKDLIKIDTIFGRSKIIQDKDSSGKPITRRIYIATTKDSINTDISNKSIDSLLKINRQ